MQQLPTSKAEDGIAINVNYVSTRVNNMNLHLRMQLDETMMKYSETCTFIQSLVTSSLIKTRVVRNETG